MNTMPQAHLEGLYVQMHRNREGDKIHPKKSEKWIEDTALHNPLPHHPHNLQGERRL